MTVGGAPAGKAARLVASDEPVVVLGPPEPYVGRGGRKLEAALDRFGVTVDGVRALDAGASTGGFTDCLLQRGARQVWAIDVGHGQLHPRIRDDERVVVREGCNVRSLTPAQIGGPVELTVADLSFIALRTVAAALVDLTCEGGTLVVLVKPQFEAGRVEAARARGIITDPAIWRRVLGEVAEAFAAAGAATLAALPSPLRGGDGNVEFLLHLRVGVPAIDGVVALLDAAVAEATGADATEDDATEDDTTEGDTTDGDATVSDPAGTGEGDR